MGFVVECSRVCPDTDHASSVPVDICPAGGKSGQFPDHLPTQETLLNFFFPGKKCVKKGGKTLPEILIRTRAVLFKQGIFPV